MIQRVAEEAFAPAKALAVVVSFALGYALRRYLIFPARP